MVLKGAEGKYIKIKKKYSPGHEIFRKINIIMK